MDSNHHAKFHPCILSGFQDTPVETEQQEEVTEVKKEIIYASYSCSFTTEYVVGYLKLLCIALTPGNCNASTCQLWLLINDVIDIGMALPHPTTSTYIATKSGPYAGY